MAIAIINTTTKHRHKQTHSGKKSHLAQAEGAHESPASSMDAIRGNRTFEDFDPAVEWSRAEEADAVKISLPGKQMTIAFVHQFLSFLRNIARADLNSEQIECTGVMAAGFKREEIRVLVDNHGHLRTRGERPVAGTKWARFQKDFKLPDNCNVDGIRAKFESETLTITLPKKIPSPMVAPTAPVAPAPVPPPRRPAAAPVREPPQHALPEPARPAPPPTVPAVPLAPAPSQRQPAERRPSLPPRLPSVPTPAEYDEPPRKTEPAPAPAPVPKLKKSSFKEEEERRMEREAMGKMEEDRKMMEENRRMMDEKKKMEEEEQAKEEMEAAAAEMARMQMMVGQPRPMAASRGQLVNVAVAVVVLVGITAYVWHTLKNATGGNHGHGGYGDEM